MAAMLLDIGLHVLLAGECPFARVRAEGLRAVIGFLVGRYRQLVISLDCRLVVSSSLERIPVLIVVSKASGFFLISRMSSQEYQHEQLQHENKSRDNQAPNSQCGMLIGRGGSKIKELQDTTKAQIKISHSADLYPGTSDRLVIIRAPPDCLEDAMIAVVKCANTRERQDEGQARSLCFDEDPSSASKQARTISVKLVIPVTAAGLLLGKGGETIRSMQAECSAYIHISQRDEVPPTLQERIVTISSFDGSLPIVALRRILRTWLENPNLFTYLHHNFAYISNTNSFNSSNPRRSPRADYPSFYPSNQSFTPNGATFFQPPTIFPTPGTFSPTPATQLSTPATAAAQPIPTDFSGFAPIPPSPFPLQHSYSGQAAQTTLTVSLDETTANLLLERGGATLQDIMMRSASQLQVSNGDDCTSGRGSRCIHISGYLTNVELAQNLLEQKVTELRTQQRAQTGQ
eukprot:gene532-3853_t